MENPFVLRPYESAELFCDREKETRDIIDDLENGINVTLISPRRYGKTGLVYHVFDELAKTTLWAKIELLFNLIITSLKS